MLLLLCFYVPFRYDFNIFVVLASAFSAVLFMALIVVTVYVMVIDNE